MTDHLLNELKMLVRINSGMNQHLENLWKATQLKESDKVPDSWRPTYITLAANLSNMTQLVRAAANRHDITISNGGSGTLIISNEPLDPSVFSSYATSTLNAYPITVLPSNASLTLKTSGAIYGYAETSSCSVNIAETLFDRLPGNSYYTKSVASETEKDGGQNNWGTIDTAILDKVPLDKPVNSNPENTQRWFPSNIPWNGH